MKLTSAAFHDGGFIPVQFTCDGANSSPPLVWDAPPSGTRSFVLLCEDPDAPKGLWHHWALYDIPSSERGLAESQSRKDVTGKARQGVNDFRRAGYDGPCPPEGDAPHRYAFRLLALSTPSLALGSNPGCREVARKAKPYILAESVLTGRYQR